VAALLLLVEDDAAIGEELTRTVTAHGYRLEWRTTGSEGLAAFEQMRPDLVLLDAGLPDIDGYTLCRWFRSLQASTPIIMVTARDADVDIVVGLDAGATDYVTKPFSAPVLLARIRAHLRAIDADVGTSLSFDALTIDPAAHRVILAGREVELRPKEFELLLFLAREAGRVVTRDRILRDLWDLHWESSTKTLDMHIYALRKKLGDDADQPRWISTVRGVGYRFEAP
jgi:DNA-binding response OmpR family regulator